MLREILSMIYESRMYSKSRIASSLGIAEDMVENLVGELLSRNYLREDETSLTCGGKMCSSCPMANCSQTPVKTYSLTDKGLAYIEK